MTTYVERFADAVREILPESVEVQIMQGSELLIAHHPDGGSMSAWVTWERDRREAVTDHAVQCWLDVATSNLRRDMYHYTPEAKAAARDLLDALSKEEATA